MANVVKYADLNWPVGTPVAGERLATNGFYTGEQLGSVMQDASTGGTEVAHSVESGVVRYGTMMQDALDEKTFPSVAD